MKSFLDSIIYFIYVNVSSDEKNKKPIISTVFLLTILEIILLLPLLLILNEFFSIIYISSFLKLSMFVRYGFILMVLITSVTINHVLINRNGYLEKLETLMQHKKQVYLRYKWLLVAVPPIVGAILLITARLLKAKI